MTVSWKNKMQEILDTESMWWDRSYLIDWAVATAIWLLSIIAESSPVFEREFSTDDPLISHPHMEQQVSGMMNTVLSLFLPLIVVGLIGAYRGSIMEIHHGLLAVWSGRGLTHLITEFLKNRVGRLRPDFLARCRWHAGLQACTGSAHEILDGRRSFPSGHSSGIFASMTFLSLFFASKTAAWCFGKSCPPSSLRASKLARFSLTLLPLFCATWVAITRVEDYRHHKEDVIIGGLIGIISSTVCYLIFWPSPFNTEHLGVPRSLYTDDDDRDINFDLTRLEGELECV
jgi:membrane-associated phospholipid phosphatase